MSREVTIGLLVLLALWWMGDEDTGRASGWVGGPPVPVPTQGTATTAIAPDLMPGDPGHWWGDPCPPGYFRDPTGSGSCFPPNTTGRPILIL
jgi:hypothetical protein